MNLYRFVELVLLGEVREMHRAGIRMHTLSAMAHGIEVCGALLDRRPFKAKGLGRSRFQLGLRSLFPKEYLIADTSVDLYGQLRSHMSHSMLPGSHLSIGPQCAHLTMENGVLHICPDALFRDYEQAMTTLLHRLRSGELPEKRIEGLDNLRSV